MNGAKILVMVMTGMLIALLGILVVGLSLGWHKTDTPSATEKVTPERAFDLVDLGQPAGSVVESVADIDGWIAVTVSGGGVPPRTFLIDPRSGKLMGEIAVNAGGVVPTEPSAAPQ